MAQLKLFCVVFTVLGLLSGPNFITSLGENRDSRDTEPAEALLGTGDGFGGEGPSGDPAGALTPVGPNITFMGLVRVKDGGSTVLQCPASNRSKKFVKWLWEDTRLSEYHEFVSRTRVHCLPSYSQINASGHSELALNLVRPELQGNYTCLTRLSRPPRGWRFLLEVYDVTDSCPNSHGHSIKPLVACVSTFLLAYFL